MPVVLQVALLEPEIASNTGNIARLCAATGTRLHLIGRLGFHLDDRHLRRAGLDYWKHVDLHRHAEWEAFRAAVGAVRLLPFSAHADRLHTQVEYREGDCLLFGSESHGLPASLVEDRKQLEPPVTIPMPAGHVRSLNLATAVGIALYEALRQLHGW
jgi:tRNA (cytidine/uridine-2'-O-)-methyltransferase